MKHFILALIILLSVCPFTAFSQPTPIVPAKIPFPAVGKLIPRKATDVKASKLGIGCEVLDRDYACYDSYKEYLGQLAVKHARFQSGWAKTEKQKGIYDFAWFDRIIDDCLSRGIQPWICLCYGNNLYPGGGGIDLGGGLPSTPEAHEAWAKYVSALVSRNKNKVFEWEIWNEADLRKQTDAAEYAALYILTAETIRRIQPRSKLTALAVARYGSEIGNTFITNFFEYLKQRGKLHLIDNVTFHGYPDNPDHGLEAQNTLFRIARKYKKNIIFKQGESGSPSSHGSSGALSNYPFTELSQAKWDLRRALFHIGRDIEFNLFSLSEFSYPQKGLNTKGKLKINPDLTVAYPKQSFYAYQNLTSVFDCTLIPQFRSQHMLKAPCEASLYIFKDTGTGTLAFTYWEKENAVSETLDTRTATLELQGVSLKTPVLLDLRTGIIYHVPASAITYTGRKTTYRLPIYDSPLLLCDKMLLEKKGLLTYTVAWMKYKKIGTLASRTAKEIESSPWSVGAEMMDRDFTVYNNWKDYLGTLGIKKARIQSGWAKTEKVKGVYDWAWLDEIIPDMVRQGIHPWVDLCYGNSIYSEGGGTLLNASLPRSNEAMQGWLTYVTALVKRYAPYVTDWEIWNEPNYRIAAADYASFLIATAKVIRKEAPSSSIIGFAIGSGVDYRYVDNVLDILRQRGELDVIDEVSHHRHIRIPEKREPEIALEQVVRKYNPRLKIRQGEAGCPSEFSTQFALNNYPWTEKIQAKHVLRRLLTDLGHDKESCCFTIIDAKDIPKGWNRKGLLKAQEDLTVAYPKPAYFAVSHLTSLFDNSIVRQKDFSYHTDRVGNHELSVYGYTNNRIGLSAVTLWIQGNIPADEDSVVCCDVIFPAIKLIAPVYVDLLSGYIYEIPRTKWKRQQGHYYFTSLPIPDYPVVITDRSLVKMQ